MCFCAPLWNLHSQGEFGTGKQASQMQLSGIKEHYY